MRGPSVTDAGVLRRVGIDALQGDIFDIQSLRQAVKRYSAALWQPRCRVRAKPQTGRSTTASAGSTANLLEAWRNAGVQRYVQQSIAFLVGGTSDLIGETAPLLAASEVKASAIDMDRLVAASGLDWVILRGVALYGPGTGLGEHWRALGFPGTARITFR